MSASIKKLSLILALLYFANSYSADFNICNFGAVDDGKTINTKAIQQAIDKCTNSGGGKVVISGKTFVTGELILKNNVTLYITKGTTLESSIDLDDFISQLPKTDTYTNYYANKALIYAEKQHDISIEGEGTIDGRGAMFKGDYTKRPYGILFSQCKDIKVKDIHLKNAAFWMLHLLKCENVFVDSVTIRSKVNANNDGIDINSCNQVKISNCDINSGDDAIVLKSTSDVVCKNVTITNCVLSTNCNALKCGTESNGGFQNINISNCAIYNTNISGIALEIVDGGKM